MGPNKRTKEAKVTQVVQVSERESPFVSVEVVERPTAPSKNEWQVGPEVDMIVQTVETGKAVKLAARTHEAMVKLQNSLRNKVGKKGLQMHYQKAAAGSIVAWAERINKT